MSIILKKYNSDYYSLAREFQVDSDSCNNPEHYTSFLLNNAYLDEQKGLGVTYILLDEDKNSIVSYLTLKASSLTYKDENNNTLGFPAVEIAELAVSKDYARQGFGRDSVEIAITKANDLRKIIGIQYLILCADPMAVDFYLHIGFEKINFKNIPREEWNKTCVPMAKKIVIY